MLKGRLIVLEGIEGAGKSTAMTQIQKILTEKNISHIITREPGGTRIGELIRAIIKDNSSDEVLHAKAELLLFYAARVQLVETVIKPALQDGVTVLSDRFELSSFAYQGKGRGQDMDFLKMLSKFCLNGFTPDLTIFLDISVEAGLKRAYKRGKIDRIEQEPLEFFENVYKCYHEELKKIPKDKCAIINAELPLELVQKEISQVIEDFTLQTVTNKNLNPEIQ